MELPLVSDDFAAKVRHIGVLGYVAADNLSRSLSIEAQQSYVSVEFAKLLGLFGIDNGHQIQRDLSEADKIRYLRLSRNVIQQTPDFTPADEEMIEIFDKDHSIDPLRILALRQRIFSTSKEFLNIFCNAGGFQVLLENIENCLSDHTNKLAGTALIELVSCIHHIIGMIDKPIQLIVLESHGAITKFILSLQFNNPLLTMKVLDVLNLVLLSRCESKEPEEIRLHSSIIHEALNELMSAVEKLGEANRRRPLDYFVKCMQHNDFNLRLSVITFINNWMKTCSSNVAMRIKIRLMLEKSGFRRRTASTPVDRAATLVERIHSHNIQQIPTDMVPVVNGVSYIVGDNFPPNVVFANGNACWVAVEDGVIKVWEYPAMELSEVYSAARPSGAPTAFIRLTSIKCVAPFVTNVESQSLYDFSFRLELYDGSKINMSFLDVETLNDWKAKFEELIENSRLNVAVWSPSNNYIENYNVTGETEAKCHEAMKFFNLLEANDKEIIIADLSASEPKLTCADSLLVDFIAWQSELNAEDSKSKFSTLLRRTALHFLTPEVAMPEFDPHSVSSSSSSSNNNNDVVNKLTREISSLKLQLYQGGGTKSTDKILAKFLRAGQSKLKNRFLRVANAMIRNIKSGNVAKLHESFKPPSDLVKGSYFLEKDRFSKFQKLKDHIKAQMFIENFSKQEINQFFAQTTGYVLPSQESPAVGGSLSSARIHPTAGAFADAIGKRVGASSDADAAEASTPTRQAHPAAGAIAGMLGKRAAAGAGEASDDTDGNTTLRQAHPAAGAIAGMLGKRVAGGASDVADATDGCTPPRQAHPAAGAIAGMLGKRAAGGASDAADATDGSTPPRSTHPAAGAIAGMLGKRAAGGASDDAVPGTTGGAPKFSAKDSTATVAMEDLLAKYADWPADEVLRLRMAEDGISAAKIEEYFIARKPARVYPPVKEGLKRLGFRTTPGPSIATAAKSSFWRNVDEFDLPTQVDSVGVPMCEKIDSVFTEPLGVDDGRDKVVMICNFAPATMNNVPRLYTQLQLKMKIKAEKELNGLVMTMKYTIGEDQRWLSAEIVEPLTKMIPTDEEYNTATTDLSTENKTNATLSVEKIFRNLGSVIHVRQRLRILQVYHTWLAELTEVVKSIKYLESGFSQIRNMLDEFRTFCSVALSVTNFLNYGGKDANVKVLSLEKLLELCKKKKGSNNDVTICHIIDEVLVLNNRKPFYDVDMGLDPIADCKDLTFVQRVIQGINDLKGKLNFVDSELEFLRTSSLIPDAERDKYLAPVEELVSKFRNNFKSKMDEVTQGKLEMEQTIKEVGSLFCMEGQPSEKIFTDFHNVASLYKSVHTARLTAASAAAKKTVVKGPVGGIKLPFAMAGAGTKLPAPLKKAPSVKLDSVKKESSSSNSASDNFDIVHKEQEKSAEDAMKELKARMASDLDLDNEDDDLGEIE